MFIGHFTKIEKKNKRFWIKENLMNFDRSLGAYRIKANELR